MTDQRGGTDGYDARTRTGGASFDVVYATAPRATRDDLAHAAAAGATWWLARVEPQHFGAAWGGVWPIADMRSYIAAGPPAR